MNNTSRNRSYQQLPDNVPGYDVGGAAFVNQPVSVSATYPGDQVIKVTGAVDRIYVQPNEGQLVIIDARNATKTVLVQASAADAAPVGVAASVPAGAYGILLASGSGWYFIPNTSGSGGGGIEIWFETLSDAAAAPGPSVKALAWIVETGAPYEFVPGNVTAIDGWYSIGPSGGTAGRWLLKSGRVSIGTSGVDQGARLSAAFAALAGKAIVELCGETFTCATPLVVVSGLTVVGNASTRIVTTMANGAGQVNAAFYAPTPILNPGVALTSNPTVESRTMPVADTATFPTGTVFVVGNGNRWSRYQVTSRSVASGAGDLTLDRPILWQFLSGTDLLLPVVRGLVDNVVISGNSMTIAGTGDRAIEMTFVQGCLVQDVNIDARAGFLGIVASYDIGGVRNVFRNVYVRGNNVAQSGIALESQENSEIHHSLAERTSSLASTGPGITLLDCQASWIIDSTSELNGLGFELNSGGAPGESTKRSGLMGCKAYENGSHGVQVINAADHDWIFGGDFCGNVGNGIYVNGAGSKINIHGAESSRNAGSGLQGTVGTIARAVQFVAKSNAQYGVDSGGDFIGLLLDIDDNRIFAGLQFSGTGTAKVAQSRLGVTHVAGGGNVAIGTSTTGKVLLTGCTFPDPIVGGTRYAVFHQAASVVEIRDCELESLNWSNGYVGIAGSTLRKYNCNFQKANVAPYTINAAGYVNSRTGNGVGQGEIVLNGVTPVVYAFPDVTNGDAIKVIFHAVGGVYGRPPDFVAIAGTGVQLTGIAGDTSRYELEIG